MSGIPRINTEQLEDRMEWLTGAAGWELRKLYGGALYRPSEESWVPVIEKLDELSRVAKRCAKHLRELGEAT